MSGKLPTGVLPYRNESSSEPPVRRVNRSELSEHASPNDLWLCIKGQVYDCTQYSKVHPGGLQVLVNSAGKDCTAMFMAVHPWVNLGVLLGAAFHVGELAEDTARMQGVDEKSEEEPPWVNMGSVRPLAACKALSPQEVPRYPCLPSLSARPALRGGSLVLWRDSGNIFAAWPWGYLIEREGISGSGGGGGVKGWCGGLTLLVQGRALSKVLSSLLEPLVVHASTTSSAPRPFLLWDMRGVKELHPTEQGALARLRGEIKKGSLCAMVLVDVETSSSVDSVAGGGAGISWGEGLEVCTGGASGAVSQLPPPHAALLVLAVGEGESVEERVAWERCWDDALRTKFYAAQLLLAL